MIKRKYLDYKLRWKETEMHLDVKWIPPSEAWMKINMAVAIKPNFSVIVVMTCVETNLVPPQYGFHGVFFTVY